MRVTIIGAGVTGLTTAIELVERGLDVAVVEQGSGLGPHACSWYAGGMLAPWCEGEVAEEPVVRCGREAISWWRKHLPGLKELGSIVVAPARDAAELKRFARRTEQHQFLDAKDLSKLEPGLEGRFSKALYFADEAHINPREALAALTIKLADEGVRIQFNTLPDNHAPSDVMVDARGFAARDDLKDLRGVRGEMLMLKSQDVNITRPVRLIHPRFPVYIVPRGDGVYMIGATQIESEQRGGVTARGMVDLLNAAYAVHPAFAEAEIIETGAEVRPAFPDNMPKLRWRGKTLYINGLFRHGFLLAPACARMAAETIINPKYKPEFVDEDHLEQSTV